MKVAYLVNAGKNSGVGLRAHYIHDALPEDINADYWMLDGQRAELRKNNELVFALESWPGVLGLKSVNWLRLGRHLKLADYDIFHATNQSLSFLTKVAKRTPTVVTVHDLIELLEPQSKFASLLNRHLHSGIKAASHIVAVSEFTAQSVRDHFQLPTEKVSVIHNAVGSDFRYIDDFVHSEDGQVLRRELQIGANTPVVLFVGSEHRRKNLPIALQAFALLKKRIPDAVFVKVGRPGFQNGRGVTLAEIDRLGIRDSVRIVEDVSSKRLVWLYNLARVLIFPSSFEGFGLPVLEAMSCGCAVLTSNSTSLPEVVGEAGVMREPTDVSGFAEDLQRLIEDEYFRSDMRTRGLVRAHDFSWDRSAHDLAEVYRRLV